MNTIFIGGSRHISHLPSQAKERLNKVISNGFSIIVGDANGADKAIQKYLLESHYKNVTVFCSGDSCRNNLGNWKTHYIKTVKSIKDFQFYATKDREMAHKADFGLMIWDGKSPGTILNVLRLLQAGKKAVLLNAPAEKTFTFKATTDWNHFLLRCNAKLQNDLHKRATPEEWQFLNFPHQSNLLNKDKSTSSNSNKAADKNYEELATALNAALAMHDPKAAVDTLGMIARARGMSYIAKDTGFSREGLYRALHSGGNPEFATVLKVMDSLGLQLMVNIQSMDDVRK